MMHHLDEPKLGEAIWLLKSTWIKLMIELGGTFPSTLFDGRIFIRSGLIGSRVMGGFHPLLS